MDEKEYRRRERIREQRKQERIRRVRRQRIIWGVNLGLLLALGLAFTSTGNPSQMQRGRREKPGKKETGGEKSKRAGSNQSYH